MSLVQVTRAALPWLSVLLVFLMMIPTSRKSVWRRCKCASPGPGALNPDGMTAQ